MSTNGPSESEPDPSSANEAPRAPPLSGEPVSADPADPAPPAPPASAAAPTEVAEKQVVNKPGMQSAGPSGALLGERTALNRPAADSAAAETEPAQAGQPTQQAQAAQPPQPTQPAQPTQPTQAAQPTQPTQPAPQNELAQQPQPTKPSQQQPEQIQQAHAQTPKLEDTEEHEPQPYRESVSPLDTADVTPGPVPEWNGNVAAPAFANAPAMYAGPIGPNSVPNAAIPPAVVPGMPDQRALSETPLSAFSPYPTFGAFGAGQPQQNQNQPGQGQQPPPHQHQHQQQQLPYGQMGPGPVMFAPFFPSFMPNGAAPPNAAASDLTRSSSELSERSPAPDGSKPPHADSHENSLVGSLQLQQPAAAMPHAPQPSQPPQQSQQLQGGPQGVPQGAPQGAPQGILQGAPQGVPQGVPQGAQGAPQGVPQGQAQPQGPGQPQGAGQPGQQGQDQPVYCLMPVPSGNPQAPFMYQWVPMPPGTNPAQANGAMSGMGMPMPMGPAMMPMGMPPQQELGMKPAQGPGGFEGMPGMKSIAAALTQMREGHKGPLEFDERAARVLMQRELQREQREFFNAGGVRPHTCNMRDNWGRMCRRTFTRPYDLLRHQETVHSVGTKVYICERCGIGSKRFSRQDSLARHIRRMHHAEPGPPVAASRDARGFDAASVSPPPADSPSASTIELSDDDRQDDRRDETLSEGSRDGTLKRPSDSRADGQDREAKKTKPDVSPHKGGHQENIPLARMDALTSPQAA